MDMQLKDWNKYELPDNTFLSLFLESNTLVQIHATLNLRKRIKKLTNKLIISWNYWWKQILTNCGEYKQNIVVFPGERNLWSFLFKKEMQTFSFTAISDDAWSELLSVHE